MKKICTTLFALTLLLSLLTGCGCKHEWVDATCEQGQYCSLCNEAGEQPALGHSRGSEANYQQGPLCAVCGAELGEALPAEFETHGLTINAQVGQDAYFTTQCYYDRSRTTEGYITFTESRVLDLTADADLISSIEEITYLNIEPVEGYEWRYAVCEMWFTDENAHQYDVYGVNATIEDYYTIDAKDEGSVANVDDTFTYPVSWMGESYEVLGAAAADETSNNDEGVFMRCIFAFRVPVGYDGVVIGLRSSAVDQNTAQHIYDLDNTNTVFCRLQ